MNRKLFLPLARRSCWESCFRLRAWRSPMARNRPWATWRALCARARPAPEHAVIDNDNLHQVMDEVQNRKLNGSLLFSFDGDAARNSRSLLRM